MSMTSISQLHTATAGKTDLLGLTLPQLQAWLAERGEPAFRAKQIYSWLYEHLASDFAGMSNLPNALRERLAYGCTFCATGQMGFDRHLQAGEIVAQVLHFARELRAEPWAARGLPGSKPIDHITNIVLMGMGEPLHNYENVLQALRILNSSDGFRLGARHMTVSTVGLAPAIRKLSQEQLQVNLAISLHAPTDELRGTTMPINRKYPLKELLAACQDYIAATRRQVTFEYVLLAGINDTPEYAHKLGELLAPLRQFAHVNCIPVNATSAEYRPPTGEAIRAFRDILSEHGVSNTVRAERGDDIAAACGQLRTRFENRRKKE
jgi:23S rRNA (adenine2503-C2)-methyltransferase